MMNHRLNNHHYTSSFPFLINYLDINVSQSKTNERQIRSLSSAYFAYTRLIKLYRDTGMRKVFIDNETIFGVKSFREGMNSLLDSANLKTKKIGDQYVKMDSKSIYTICPINTQ